MLKQTLKSCPNCHRKLHYVVYKNELERYIKKNSKLKKSGLDISMKNYIKYD